MPVESVKRAFASITFPARLEKHGNIIIDGAHNPDAVKRLLGSLSHEGAKFIAVFGAMKDKDYEQGLRLICEKADSVLTCTVNIPRAESGKVLAETALKYCDNVISCENSEEALKMAVKMRKDNQFIVICGSLYLCSEARILLNDVCHDK